MAEDSKYCEAWFRSSSTHDMFLFNPISGEVHQLPSLTTIPCYQRFMMRKRHNVSCFVTKMELSSAKVSECIVAAAFDPCSSSSKPVVAICRPENKQWSIFTGKTEDENFKFYDSLLCETTLYLMGTVEHFKNYNLELGAGHEVNFKIIPGLYSELDQVDVGVMADDFMLLSKGEFNLYLVESTSNEIFLIKRIYDLFIQRMDEDEDIYPKTSGFYVFNMDPSTGQWHRLYNVDDQVFFISLGGSSSVSAKDFEGVRGNCIYFAEDHDYCVENPCPISRKCGVFYLEDGRIERPFPSLSLPLRSQMSWFTPIL
ncbi:hypothetical protein PTKIN_Ptkin02bG0226000 [Pterospermum kingtungense]